MQLKCFCFLGLPFVWLLTKEALKRFSVFLIFVFSCMHVKEFVTLRDACFIVCWYVPSDWAWHQCSSESHRPTLCYVWPRQCSDHCWRTFVLLGESWLLHQRSSCKWLRSRHPWLITAFSWRHMWTQKHGRVNCKIL